VTALENKLLDHLSDGNVHSGQVLAEQLGVTRAAVWKQIGELRELGLEVDTLAGRGYRLRRPLDLLDAERIRGRLRPSVAEKLGRLDVLRVVDSTNSHLLREGVDTDGLGVCLAELQTAGRGRRGRSWQSPFAANIYLSIGRRFPETPPDLSALSLAAGVLIADALVSSGVSDVGLKWPNDVLWRDRKLCGVLIELKGEMGSGCEVVLGAGINVHMPGDVAADIDRPWVDLDSILGNDRPTRSELAATLIDHLVPGLETFARQGFEPFRERWRQLDAVTGSTVEVEHDGNRVTGVAESIDADGALRLRTGEGLQRFVSGDVTLRVKA